MVACLLVLLLSVSPLPQKKRDWVNGKIVDVQRSVRVDRTPVPAGPQMMEEKGLFFQRASWTYVIVGKGMRFTVRTDRPQFPFETGSDVKFAVEKKDLYFLDSKNKEIKGTITKAESIDPSR